LSIISFNKALLIQPVQVLVNIILLALFITWENNSFTNVKDHNTYLTPTTVLILGIVNIFICFIDLSSKIRINLPLTNENNIIELEKVSSTKPKPITNNGYKQVCQEVDDKEATDKESHPQPHTERIPSVDGSDVISEKDMKFISDTGYNREDEDANDNDSLPQPQLKRIPSVDGSCVISEEDMKFIALHSKVSFEDIQTNLHKSNQGMIDKPTFREIALLCYPDIDVQRLQDHVYKVFGGEETGLISFHRFMLVIIALSSGSQMENIEKIFYMLDFNNNGVISSEEYGSVTSDIFLLANERKVSMSNQDHLTKLTYEEMDSNKDGKVDLKEFIKACKKHDYIIFQYLKDFVTMHSKKCEKR